MPALPDYLSLQQAKNLLRGTQTPYATLSAVRKSLDPTELPDLARWLPSVTRASRPVFTSNYPVRWRDLKNRAPLETIGAESEICWAVGLLRRQSSRLGAFRTRTEAFEQSLLAGGYRNAGAILDQIQTEFGVSFWLLEMRIAFIQLTEGLEAQKKFLEEIRDVVDSGLVSFTAAYVSQRNEPKSNPFRFYSTVKDLLTTWNVDSDLRHYLLLRLIDKDPSTDSEVDAVLRHEAASATIDYYETLLRLARNAASGATISLRGVLYKELRSLAREISDPRLQKLLYVLSRGSETLSLARIQDISLQDRLVSDQPTTTHPTTVPTSVSWDISHWLAAARLSEEKLFAREGPNGRPSWSPCAE